MICITGSQDSGDSTKRLSEMEPLEVCVLINDDEGTIGDVIMRTASSSTFEVMSMSSPGEDEYWSGESEIYVRELRKGETYTLKLS